MKGRTALIFLFLPLIAVITLFTFVGATVSLYRLPVTAIEITTPSQNGMIAVDLASYAYDLYITAKVYPAEAYNRNYTLTVEGLSGTNADNLVVESDGLVVPEGTGVFKVTAVSSDGGFRDSVTVGVYSSATLSLSVTAIADDGKTRVLASDAATELPAGKTSFFAETYPAEVCPDVVWSVTPVEGQPEDSCRINAVTGEAQFCFPGKYAVGVSVSPAVSDISENVFVVDILPPDGISVGGNVADCSLPVATGATHTDLYVYCDGEPVVLAKSAGIDKTETVSFGDKRYRVSVGAAGGLAGESVTLSDGNGTVCTSFEEGTADISARYSSDGKLLFKAGVGATLVAEGVFGDGVTPVFEAEGDVSVTDRGDGTCFVYAEQYGTGTVTLYAEEGGERRLLCSRQVVASAGYAALAFEASSDSFGMEDCLVLGGVNYDGNTLREGDVFLGLTAVADGEVTSASGEEIEVSVTGARGEAQGADGGVDLRVMGDGGAKITAVWKYAKAFYCDVYAELNAVFVASAVNVYDEAGFRAAMQSAVPVALHKDIMLGGRLLDESGMPLAGASEKQDKALGTLPTSSDWTYYANTSGVRPDVRFCLEITADVYGNGHEVNADNLTSFNASVSSSAHFDGPLYFVSLPGVASVTAQDNIVFLVRTDGVNIRNVSLKGCADDALYTDDGTLDLEGLRYRGTVLEIMADCTVTASRISGGRTAVRVFGRDGVDPLSDDIDPDSERITVVLNGCIVSCAREFLVKTGTNRKVRGHYDENAPEAISPLLSAGGVTFAPRRDDNLDDEIFRENFLLTDLTLKDCVLYGSGLFAVGVECGFAGELLDGAGSLGSLVAGAGWKGLAGTSYAAVLRIAGDTRFYEWKKLSSVDSSTLIETYGGGAMWNYLNLDIKQMLHKVRDFGGEGYADIISLYGGEEYVHGGIAFYGGGKNYSVADFSEYTGVALTEYFVNLSVLAEGEKEGSALNLQGTSLPLAAGKEDFRFFIADAGSYFGVGEQEELFASGKAFDFLFRRDIFRSVS